MQLTGKAPQELSLLVDTCCELPMAVDIFHKGQLCQTQLYLLPTTVQHLLSADC